MKELFVFFWNLLVALRHERRSRKASRNGKAIILPSAPGPRHPCPALGFVQLGSGMYDVQRPSCGLFPVAPCEMIAQGQKPCWTECPVASEHGQAFLQLEGGVRVYPKDFSPLNKGSAAWSGVPFKRWYAAVMSPDCPRPDEEPEPLPVIKVA